MKPLDKEKVLSLISDTFENYELTSVSVDNGMNEFALDGWVQAEPNGRRTITLELRKKSVLSE